jgi:flagellar hook-associated protein 1
MSSLLSSLSMAGNALDLYQQALNVVQNNITNANTAGYASQSLNLEARPLDITSGLVGGVAAQGLESARDEYTEEEVRRQSSSLGFYQAQADATSQVDSLVDVSGDSGVAADLNSLFQSFSAWSVTPSSSDARQNVISSATTFAQDLSGLANQMKSVSTQIGNQIGSTVTQINQLSASIAQYNATLNSTSGQPDPGTDASLHAALEQLSSLVDITTLTQPNGTVNVVLSGGAPLVLGDTQYQISAGLADNSTASNPKGTADSVILDWQGNEITSQVQGGQLGGYLNVRNSVLASLIGDGQQVGSLNTFAAGFANAVNGILTSGSTQPDGTGKTGAALFTYDASDPTLAAASFAVSSTITADQLAPVDSQGNANGNALALASLADSTASGGVNGLTFTDDFSQIASAVGQASSLAQANQTAQEQVVTQTQALRDQISGVSLNDQAIALLQYQRSYQAIGEFISTINNLTTTLFNMMSA